MDANGSLDATVTIVPGHLMYAQIPADNLRHFVDGIFSGFAKNPIADSVSGYGHRYVAGHDLLIDVPRTISTHGPFEGLKQAGHIVLTDFPTKAGIPIPAFSQSGLGQLLEQAGIPRGWLQVNISDAGWGIYAISEGSNDLAVALQGVLAMDQGVFFDTFVEGTLEVYFAVLWQNPFLLAGGLENIFSGIVASWNTLSVYVDPLDFFGAAGTSALIGFVLAHGLADESLNDAGKDAIRSGTVGALYTLSPAFGFGALAGFTAYRLGGALAKHQQKEMNARLSIDENSYRLLVEEICNRNIPVRELLVKALPQFILLDKAPTLPSEGTILESNGPRFSSTHLTFSTSAAYLQANVRTISTKIKNLSDDSPILLDWYQTALDQSRPNNNPQ